MYPDTGSGVGNPGTAGPIERCGTGARGAAASTATTRASVVGWADRIDAHVPAHGLNADLVTRCRIAMSRMRAPDASVMRNTGFVTGCLR